MCLRPLYPTEYSSVSQWYELLLESLSFSITVQLLIPVANVGFTVLFYSQAQSLIQIPNVIFTFLRYEITKLQVLFTRALDL